MANNCPACERPPSGRQHCLCNLEDVQRIFREYRDAVRAEGDVTVTCNEAGDAIAVTRTDDEHRILRVIWERK